MEENWKEDFYEAKQPVTRDEFRMFILRTIEDFFVQNRIDASNFLIGVRDFYDSRGYVTPGQYNALVRLFDQYCYMGIDHFWYERRQKWVDLWERKSDDDD